ncbi:MAG: hypothetical protein JST66_00730 [Bacteroidetes bacterium]|nr:hypothetical protein [Bacteroidota bacterium]
MSENPFKIIRPTDQPPENLRKEVMGSVKFVLLLMRFLQLFMADYANVLFENVRVIGEDGERKDGQELR